MGAYPVLDNILGQPIRDASPAEAAAALRLLGVENMGDIDPGEIDCCAAVLSEINGKPSGEIPDNVMQEAADLYLRMHRYGVDLSLGHSDALHSEALGRFEGFMGALRSLDLVRFDGCSMTPYRTLEEWLFKTGKMTSSQTLSAWADAELDRR